MLSTSVKLHDDSRILSDINNSGIMDDFINDLEIGVTYSPPRHPNKKMKKRKQLDALLKFRSSTSKSARLANRLSNEALITSEDESLLSNKTSVSTKMHSTRYRRCCSYTRHILSFCFVCIFMIVCVGLAYANIELKTEVQNLSFRVTEIEKKFSNFEVNRILSTIEQLKTRLNLIERWNVSYLYDRLQKIQKDFRQIQNLPSTETSMDDETVDIDLPSKLNSIEQKSAKLSEVTDELDKLSHDAEDQFHEKTRPFDKYALEKVLEEEQTMGTQKNRDQLRQSLLSLNTTVYSNALEWFSKLKSLQDDLRNLNQSQQIEELTLHFQELTNLVHNSSDKVSVMVNAVQSDLDKLRNQIDACKCSKDPVHLKPPFVESNQLQQSFKTKPSVGDAVPTTTPASTSSTSPTLIDVSEKFDPDPMLDVTPIANQSLANTN